MDRKGKSKVGVLCLFFAVIALIFGGFFCKISYEKNLYEEQKKELSVIYPNLADELRENISYYAEKQMQAVGMSDGQLQIMLQLEGLFYTIGTLLIAVGGGSIAGYPVFLWAKDHGMFNIRNYHYPLEATFIMIALLVVVQVIMIFAVGKSVKKDSLIDRIRFDN